MHEVADTPTKLLTSRQAAERLGVSTDTIRALARSAVLPPIRFGDRGLYRFRPQDVARMLEPREAA
jgi:excisionase family DNA binding protein